MAEPTSAADNQILKPHSNAIVPHKIANHDTEAVQLNVWNGTEWVNIYDGNDMRNMNIDLHKVSKVVEKHAAEIPAVESAANSAVEQAESAVSASKVNSEAIAAQSEAVSEAKSAISSATAAIQQTAATAASDAAKIRADVAQVQNEVNTAKAANSASVEALKSDVSAAKQDLADVHDSLTKAQAAAEESQKAIDKSIAQINSDIEQGRKDIASAQQANADTAKQLDTYSKQAQDQGKTIKSIQDKQDGFTATLADVQGNVTQVSDKVDGLSASLKDSQDNVASVKAQADQLSATLTDHAKSIATLTASAKELSSTLEDADGRLSKVEQTAQANSSTLSDVQGDLSQVKQDATTLTATLKDAQGNISTLQQKADSVSAQLASAQGDIASLQTDVTGIKATLVSHEGDIHTLQADSKTLKDDMQDAQGDISTLKKTSTDVTSELKDHAGRISKVEQTATTLSSDVSDQQGRISKVEQKATGTEQTVANQQGQINDIKTDVSGVHETITGQGNQIATINTSLNGLNTKYEGVSGDLNNLKSQAQWVTVTDTVDLNNIKTPCHEFLKGAVTNAPNEVAWWYLTVEGSEGNRITQTVIADQSNNRYTRRWADGWSAWVRDATQTDVTNLSNQITTNSTQITQNQQAIALKADQTTVNNLSGEVNQNKAQLKVQADQISSKVSSDDFGALNDRFNNIQIGGRNLLLGTSIDEKSGKSYIFAGYQIAGGLRPNTTYTFSGWARVDQKAMDNKQNVFVCAYTKDWSWSQWLNISSSLTAKYSKVTFTTPTGNNFAPYVTVYLQHPNNDPSKDSISGQGFISKLKLEEGNVATDWTPAPEDTIAAIQKNATAIDQTNSKISLKADQTEVNSVKNTATNNSSRLDVMANEIQSKVTSTDVNNIVDSKGYATTSTVQSLITQKAGTINESITNLTSEVNSNNGGGVNLQVGTADCSFIFSPNGGSAAAEKYDDQTKMIHYSGKGSGFYLEGVGRNFIPEVGETYTFSADIKGKGTTDGGRFNYEGSDTHTMGAVALTDDWKQISNTVHVLHHAGTWVIYVVPDSSGNNDFYVKHIKIERGSVATPWTPAPSDNATVTQVQQITASIDGLQSTVANKADKSQITQLSNVIQSKVNSSDYNSKVSQLSNDINARVTKGDLLSQINIEAGRTLIQSNKIYFDADSFVMSPNSKAFIPSAFITDLSADKITTGTLDASKLHVKNFSADNISGGTLSGITVKTGDKNRYFQTSKDSIYWVRDNKTSLIGTDQYINPSDGIVIADTHSVTLTTWHGATINSDGSITNEAGNIGHPKIVIDLDGKWNPEASGGSNWDTGTGATQIGQWVADKEYTNLVQGEGFHVRLDDQNNNSTFSIQKDNCAGAYLGLGDHGNQINLATNGNGQSVNVMGDFHVTGSKNSIVNTKQGYLAINAYETAEYYFGDIGESNTGSTSQVVIGIDRIFNDLVNTNIQYQVFVTPYTDAHVWVEKRYNNRFVVKSDKPNAEFGWELKAKRKGYESNRLRRVSVDVNPLQLKGETK